ncbi:hypothetical protein PCAR4_1000056 [Paraburkholderia caribensis]|nr:hypothetical protein PCAR4_1000056 [Paraburkholderia caribensis]
MGLDVVAQQRAEGAGPVVSRRNGWQWPIGGRCRVGVRDVGRGGGRGLVHKTPISKVRADLVVGLQRARASTVARHFR